MVFLTIVYYTFFLLLSSFTALISGFFVYLKDRKKLENISWLLLNVNTAIWSFGYYNLISATDKNIAFLSNWILHWGAILIPIFYFLFIIAVTQTYEKYKILIFPYALLGFFFSVINISEYFIRDVYPKFIFNYAPDAGPLYIYFAAYFYGIVLYALWILLKVILKSGREDKQRLKFILYASLAGFLGGGSTFLLTFNINFPPYPIALFAFYPIIIAYAILRHHLFNIKVIATEFLVFVIWISLLARVFIAETIQEFAAGVGLFALVVFFGILLIRSVLKEVERREELERLAKELDAANKELERLDQTKSEFISMASHQFRAPLTVIKGYISMILGGSFGVISEELRQLFDKISSVNQQLVELINKVLELSRLESGKIRYEISENNFGETMKKVIEEMGPEAGKRKLIMREEGLEKCLNLIFPFDRERMESILKSIIENAVYYSAKGVIFIKAEIINNKNGERLLFSVKDEGMGINEQDHARVFTKFFRSKQAIYLNPNGLGVNMYSAKRIIEDHQGKIWVESEGEGKGSTFFIELSWQ